VKFFWEGDSLDSRSDPVQFAGCAFDQWRISPTLGPLKCSQGPPDRDLQKKVMLHHETEWPPKQNILTAGTILAEPGP